MLSAICKKMQGKLWSKERGLDGASPLDIVIILKKVSLLQERERTPLVPLQACAGWAKTVNSYAHPRILLPQNRSLPHLLASPFPHQPEPRCNTLDFAKQSRVPTGMLAPPLETQRQRGFSPLNSPYFLRRWVSKLQKCSLERLLRKCKRKSVPMRGGLPFLLTI